MFLIFDEAAEEVGHLVGLDVFGRVDLVVGDKRDTAADEPLLQHHHLEQRLRATKAITFESQSM